MPTGLEALVGLGFAEFAARALSKGKAKAAIKIQIANKVKQASDSDIAEVIHHGERMHNGAQTVQEKVRHWPRDQQGRFVPRAHLTDKHGSVLAIFRDDFPIMPRGFHADSPESRFWFDVEIELPDMGKWLITKVGFATVPDPWDIYQAALQEQLRRIRKSPSRFGLSPDDLQGTELVRIIAVGRTF